MVEVRFFGPIKEENFFIKASEFKGIKSDFTRKRGLKRVVGRLRDSP